MMRVFEPVKKLLIRYRRRTWITKRQEFVAETAILTGLFLLTQLVSLEVRYPFVLGLAVLTYGLSAFVLRGDLKGIEWVTLLVLPTLFTGAVAMFYFLLPVRWLTRLPVALLYGVGMYALLLTENIYNVAAGRTIALLRAAHSVGFLLTIFTYFLLVRTVLAFRFNAAINVFLIGAATFILVLSTVWSMELTQDVSRRVWRLAIAVTVFLMEIVWVFSFLPTKATLQAIVFTASFYSVVGMAQQYIVEKLYKKTMIEFFVVAAIVFILALFATSWHAGAV